MMDTIGFLELNSIAKGVEAADIVVKTADVRLAFAKAGCPGKYYILLTGEVAAVRAAVDAAHGLEEVAGLMNDSVVIPAPHPDMIRALY